MLALRSTNQRLVKFDRLLQSRSLCVGADPETGSYAGPRVAVFSDRCPGVFGIVSSYHIVVLCLNPLQLKHFLLLLSSPLSLGTEEMTTHF